MELSGVGQTSTPRGEPPSDFSQTNPDKCNQAPDPFLTLSSVPYSNRDVANSNTLKLSISYRQIEREDDPAFEGFARVYEQAFSRPPYFEKYGDEEVRKHVWAPHIPHCLIVAEHAGEVVGFACAHPVDGAMLSHQACEYIIAHGKGFNPEEAIYVSELGVREDMERQGIGSKLVLDLYCWGLEHGYKYFSTRTAGMGSNSLKLFKRLKGQEFGVQVVESGENNVLTASSSRQYLWGNLAEVIREQEMRKSAKLLLLDEETKIQECYPGGNDTYIIFSPKIDRDAYGTIDGLVKERAPNFEQGAFLERSDSPHAVVRMQMAGGEFCGNALRSTAALLAEDFWSSKSFSSVANYELVKSKDSKSIELPLEASGTTQILKASVTSEPEGYMVETEMPCGHSYSDISEVTVEIENQTVPATQVRMQGIVHILVDELDLAFEADKCSYEKRLHQVIKGLSLTDEPAVGLIFYRREDNGIFINPIVWVKQVQSCFYESACGTGTMALALSFAKEDRAKVLSLDVIQPSSYKINARVESHPESQEFRKAWIKGLVILKGDLNARGN